MYEPLCVLLYLLYGKHFSIYFEYFYLNIDPLIALQINIFIGLWASNLDCLIVMRPRVLSMSWSFKWIASLIRNPAEYIKERMHLCFIFSICPRMAATSCSLKTPYHIYNRLIIDKRNLIIGILCSYIHLRPNHINNLFKMKTMESSIFGLFGDAGLYSIKKIPR